MKKNWTLNVFHKILLSYLLTVCIPICGIGLFSAYNYSVELKDEWAKTTAIKMQHLSEQADSLISTIDNLSLQLSFTSNINALLASPYEASMYDYYSLKTNIQNQITASSLIHSAYVYFKLNDKVLTTNEGFYGLDDFYDKLWLKDVFNSQETINDYGIRRLPDYNGMSGEEIISFSRKIPLIGKNELGYLVVNLSKVKFFEALDQLIAQKKTDNEYIIVSSEGNKLLHTNAHSADQASVANLLKGITFAKQEDAIVAEENGRKQLISYLRLPNTEWILVEVSSFDWYQENLNDKLTHLSKIILFILMVSFGLSYLFALTFYSPWKKLIKSYASNVFQSINSHKDNEYTIVNKGIDHLINENRKFKSVIEQRTPLFRQRLIQDAITNPVTDGTPLDQQLRQMGINLNGNSFAVCVVDSDMRDYELSDDYAKIKMYMFETIETSFRTVFPSYGTIIDDGRFAFILCFDSESALKKQWKQQISEVCRTVGDELYDLFQLGVQYSIGEAYDSVNQLHASYVQARRGMKYKALYNQSDVVFMDEALTDRGFEYPVLLQKRLTGAIKAKKEKELDDAITALFKHYVHNDKFSHERKQEMIVILLCSIMNELQLDGLSHEMLSSVAIMKAHECRNTIELDLYIRKVLQALMAAGETSGQENDSGYVAAAIAYMKSEYRKSISISDIADHVGLSSSYLSRIFKAEKGQPPLEYLTRYRIACSKELLRSNKRHSLQEISSMIGYADVHSFIRYFKKHEAVTPGEYRKMDS